MGQRAKISKVKKRETRIKKEQQATRRRDRKESKKRYYKSKRAIKNIPLNEDQRNFIFIMLNTFTEISSANSSYCDIANEDNEVNFKQLRIKSFESIDTAVNILCQKTPLENGETSESQKEKLLKKLIETEFPRFLDMLATRTKEEKESFKVEFAEGWFDYYNKQIDLTITNNKEETIVYSSELKN